MTYSIMLLGDLSCGHVVVYSRGRVFQGSFGCVESSCDDTTDLSKLWLEMPDGAGRECEYCVMGALTSR